MIRRAALGLLLAGALPRRVAATETPIAEPLAERGAALADSAFLLQSSEHALHHARRPELRRFARHEILEQQAMLEARRAADFADPTPIALDLRHAAALQRLRGTGPGEAYDRAYLAAQIEGHEELEGLLRGLAGRSALPAERAIATLAAAMAREHLSHLGRLQA